MSYGTEITRVWERANHACGALAEAVAEVKGDPSHEARGRALVLLDEAKRTLNTAASLADFQINDLSKSLRAQ